LALQRILFSYQFGRLPYSSIFGDFTLAALMKKNQIDYPKSFSIIILDRLITLLIAVFIFTPFTIILVLPVSPIMVWAITSAALAINLIGNVAFSLVSTQHFSKIFSHPSVLGNDNRFLPQG